MVPLQGRRDGMGCPLGRSAPSDGFLAERKSMEVKKKYVEGPELIETEHDQKNHRTFVVSFACQIVGVV